MLLDNPELLASAADPNAVATFFAPSDAGFAAAMLDNGITLEALQASDPDTVKQLFAYHTVPGAAVTSGDLAEGVTVAPTALEGYNLTVTKSGSKVTIRAVLSTATVVLADIKGGKTVIHIIDYLLLPFSIAPRKEFSSPLAALASLETCNIIFQMLLDNPQLLASAVDPTAVATFFAPSDAGFAAAMLDNGITLEAVQASDPDTVKQLFAYHTVPGAAVTSGDLAEGVTVAPTALEGYNLTVTKSGSEVTIKAVLSTATVVLADIKGGKTAIHVIDYLLMPFSITPTVKSGKRL
ncbi:hypothetical protein HYH03_008020 [Edaphochlamys debaryana]|uniref:FAS1 domain-containing protein n=1 Tax=Edaphochlamys debaryana TaxID=47281 RepID=A0A835Y0U3_9CHLO|nr:hypothetical protein HYH03_008020 [Edaphochlamys debaryana]|eukprot:KAG2493801.1 hypothetical protein HYH03_008020 [Edaphochlamys debaryana]